jgi:hypothetical protein
MHDVADDGRKNDDLVRGEIELDARQIARGGGDRSTIVDAAFGRGLTALVGEYVEAQTLGGYFDAALLIDPRPRSR